ncbi:Pr6Pr family membrane protein [Conyzicola lurida]
MGAARLVFALVCLVALIFRFLWGLGSATFTAGNFFAYLTMQSNIAFLLVCVVGGIVALRTETDPHWLTNLHALVLSWILVAGIVFAILVQQAGERQFQIEVPWSDQVLHFYLPAAALVEWVFGVGRGRAQWRYLGVVVGYPVVWGIITLVRGAFVGWYPYFFLDPGQVTDPVELAVYCGVALSAFAIVGTGVFALSRRISVAP